MNDNNSKDSSDLLGKKSGFPGVNYFQLAFYFGDYE